MNFPHSYAELEGFLLPRVLMCKVNLVCLTSFRRACYLWHRSIAKLFKICVVKCVFNHLLRAIDIFSHFLGSLPFHRLSPLMNRKKGWKSAIGKASVIILVFMAVCVFSVAQFRLQFKY